MSGSVFFVVFTVLLFLGSLFEKIFGSELLFLSVVVGLVFFDSVLPMFLLYILVFRSRKCLEKILFMSGLVFWVRSLFFWFFRRRRLFSPFLERESLGSNRAHPHTHLVFLFVFLVFVPAAPGLSPAFGRASFLSRVLSGCHSGPRAFWRLLDSLGTWGGSSLLAPLLRPCFSGREVARVFPFLFCFAAARFF